MKITFNKNLKNPKWLLGAPKWLTGPGNVATPGFVGAPIIFLLNKFFDQSTPSMRKVDNGEKRERHTLVPIMDQ